MGDYIKWIRGKVGHEKIFLNCSGACIVNENNEILLQKRNKEDDIWGIPGGIVEIGESIEEAAIREVKEETGLDIKIENLIGVYSKYFFEYHNGDKAQTICYAFRANVIGGTLNIDNNETYDLQYFNRHNLPTLFAQQHTDMINDFFDKKVGVYR
ncbi:MAG: NUDIX domain-containing protein [Defluviitaleaceae bacterium]|nr:NUDIX domain-containing protein [Defluviitaleaceae bacterium]